MKRRRSNVYSNQIVKRQRRDSGYMAMPRGNVQGRALARAGYRTVPRTRGVYAQGEMKYFECGREAYVIAASANWTGTEADPNVIPTANMNTLFCPEPGTGVSERIGKKVKLLGFRIRGHIYNDPFAVAGMGLDGALVRLLLVQDMQTNATQCQGEDVMNNIVTTVEGIPNSFQNKNNFGRFRVIKDKIFKFDDYGVTASTWVSSQIRYFKWNIKFKEPITVNFNAGVGGTVADIVDNSFHLIVNSNSQNPQMLLDYSCRGLFKE